MKLLEAIEVLESHNKWRRGEDDGILHSTARIGVAIETVLEEVKKHVQEPLSFDEWLKVHKWVPGPTGYFYIKSDNSNEKPMAINKLHDIWKREAGI